MSRWRSIFNSRDKRKQVRPGRYAPVRPDPLWWWNTTTPDDFFTFKPGGWVNKGFWRAVEYWLAFRWLAALVGLLAVSVFMLLR